MMDLTFNYSSERRGFIWRGENKTQQYYYKLLCTQMMKNIGIENMKVEGTINSWPNV